MSISSISGKRYRIRSGIRFSLFIAISIIVVVIISNAFLGLNDASSLTEYEYKEIEIYQGDTLWDIAGEYMDGYKDIRRAVYILKEINGIEACELRTGQTILVPVN